MSVVKVIEIIAESEKGWEAAAKEAVSEASKTVKNIRSLYVESFQAIVENNEIINYRINAKISFVVGEKK